MTKDIRGYETYSVDEHGNVWSKRRGKYLKTDPNSSGYKRVTLCRSGVCKRFFIHQIVYETFGSEYYRKGLGDRYCQIDHIDRNRQNNHISNLRKLSPRDNSLNTGGAFVGFVKDGNSYRVRASVNGKRVEVGRYKTKSEAILAYVNFISGSKL